MKTHETEPLTGDAAAVWAAMNAVYQGFLAGAPETVDAHLHPDVTIWDSAYAPLVLGLDGLAALRSTRSGGPPSPDVQAPAVTIEADSPVVDVWGEVALLRHLLRVRSGDAPVETVRNTSVWRRVGGRWLAVHNHEDVLPAPQQP